MKTTTSKTHFIQYPINKRAIQTGA